MSSNSERAIYSIDNNMGSNNNNKLKKKQTTKNPLYASENKRINNIQTKRIVVM